LKPTARSPPWRSWTRSPGSAPRCWATCASWCSREGLVVRTDFRGLWLLAGAWLAALLRPPGWVVLVLLALFAGLFALLLRARHDAPHAAPWFTGPLVLLLAALAVLGTHPGAADCTLPDPGAQQRRITAHFTDPPRPVDGGGVAGAAQLDGYQHQGQWRRCEIPIHLSL